MQDTVMSILWQFPYNTRQFLFRTLVPRVHKHFQDMRKTDTKIGRSLKPYDEQKCIFVHVPKCAGISISVSLFGNQGGAHLRIPHYQLIFSKREFEAYFKFTFVRNPWDRLVSAFLFLKKGGANRTDKLWAEEHLSRFGDFHTFVTDWVDQKNVNMMKHFVPQHKFICEPRSEIPSVDFIGRFERLHEDFSHIQIKLRSKSDLQYLNRTEGSKKDYRDYYTDATRKIVADVYQEDIRIFGYDFNNTFYSG